MLALSDTPAERAVLAGICQYGNNAYLDIADIIQDSTFTDEQNCILFKCVKHILSKDDVKLDIPTIHSAAKDLGFLHLIDKGSEVKYLQALFTFPINLENVRKFAAKIRKLEIAKLLHLQLENAQEKLLEVNGSESITEILNIAEDSVFNFTALLSDGSNCESLGAHVQEFIDDKINNPCLQVGLSTGFPAYDQAIGGGLRGSTCNVIAARPKQGKSLCGDNIAHHVAKNLNIRVLNLDTELTDRDHLARLLSLMTEVPINDIETGKFAKNPYHKEKILEAVEVVKNLPYDYEQLSGKSFEEQLAIIRRWITTKVGLNEDGTAKPCLVIYDYIKLMSAGDISSDLKEYQIIGFMLSQLHNLACKYNIPILCFAQLNRDGNDKENTAVVSGSDRIIWLCSNFSIFKDKTEEEIAEGGPEGAKYNKKMVVVATRHGPGMDFRNYINVEMKGWCAKIVEGRTKFEHMEACQKQQEGFTVTNNDTETEFN